MFAVLAAAAEYELELHAERQAEGIAAAKATRGRGPDAARQAALRPARIPGPAELDTLRRLVHEDGWSVTEAARTLKIGRSTAYEAMAQAAVSDQALLCRESGAGITAPEVCCPNWGCR